MGKVAIIIISWNGKHYLEECLPSLDNQDYKNFKIFLVDNNSKDGTVEWIKQNYPNIKLIQNKSNLGFSKANNIALKEALKQDFKYFILLNQDTVVQPNFISSGINILKQPKVGACCPKIVYYKTNIIWYAGSPLTKNYIDFWKKGIHNLMIDDSFGKEDNGEFDSIKEVGYASGCAFFTKKEIFKKIGLLDENFFFNWETKDLSKRIRDLNYKVLYFPNTIVQHNTPKLESQNFIKKYFLSKNSWYQVSGFLKFMNKHYGLIKTSLFLLKGPLEIFWLINLVLTKKRK